MSSTQDRLNPGPGDAEPRTKKFDSGLDNPAVYKPTWFVGDDINIDLFTVVVSTASFIAWRFFNVSLLYAAVPLLALVLPLRLFFPLKRVPTGTVLITGGSSGIGAELAYIFAQHGNELILVARDAEQLEAVKRNVETKYGGKAITITADLSIPGNAKNLYDYVTKERGLQVDVLVNNAGIGAGGDPFSQSIELTEKMTTLNCTTPVQLIQLFGGDMCKRNKGWMLQVTSVGGWMASPGHNLYHSTKHYLRAYSEALSVDLRAYPGVINCQLMPGPTHTQWIHRSQVEETVMMAASGAVEDPVAVAQAGYNGLVNCKRMVFSSWNGALTSTLLHLAPRSVHLTFVSFMNAPLRGLLRQKDPETDQKNRGKDL